MKALVTTACAVVALALCVPIAGAEPDGYQPQLSGVDTSDVVSRHLDKAVARGGTATDVVDRAVAKRQWSVPQDSFDRAPLADRPVSAQPTAIGGLEAGDGLGGFGLLGALALAVALGAAAASVLTPLGRRTLAHR